MTSQFILKRKALAASLVQIDIVLAGYGKRLAVGGEGVIRDGMVEEVVDFRRRHSNVLDCAIGGALYYCLL